MSEDIFSDSSPWGSYRPRGWGGFWLQVARAFPGGWPWSRFALVARRLARPRLAGPVDTTLWGHRMRLFPDRSVSEARILFLPRSWDRTERALLKRWMTPGFTFLDVGANVGAYSFWALSLAGDSGRVVAVEPDPALARQLRYNVRTNGAEDRMRVVEVAVAASGGDGTLILDGRNSGKNRLATGGEDPVAPGAHPFAHGAGAVPVRVVTLARVVRDAALQRIDCLKVDVEGREADVIKPFLAEAPRSLWPRGLIVELKHVGARGEAAGAADEVAGAADEVAGGADGVFGAAVDAASAAELEAWITARGYRLVRRTKLNGIFRL